MARVCVHRVNGRLCGRITTTGNRCDKHRAAHERAHNQARAALHDPAYQRARAQHIARHVQTWGLLCHGYGRTAHAVPSRSDLTIDHVAPRAAGTHDPLDETNWMVLCRSCNSRKGHRGVPNHREHANPF